MYDLLYVIVPELASSISSSGICVDLSASSQTKRPTHCNNPIGVFRAACQRDHDEMPVQEPVWRVETHQAQQNRPNRICLQAPRTFMCLAGCRVAVSRPSLKFILCEHFLNFKCCVDCLFCMWDRRQPEDENRPKLISKHRFSNSSCRASLCLSVLAAHIPAVYLL